jgi:dihydrofolate reductase
MLSMIVAVSENGVIGKNNDLLWHLPDDLKHFKRTTRGHHVIMGRKTFESQGSRPLPKRTNIIITRSPHYHAEGCIVVHSLEEALAQVKDDEEPFIIGGEKIYRMAFPRVNRIYLTRVHATLEGDTYFPEPDMNEWREVDRYYHEKDEKHAHPFSVITLERQQPSPE